MITIKSEFVRDKDESMLDLFDDYGYKASNCFIAEIPEDANVIHCFNALVEAMKHEGFSNELLDKVLDAVYDVMSKESEVE